eukprot:CAMPEP_0119545772 /NCGR_PEP_ID=MMETSP1352-20130426/431_1 /TAXON_ID=265584 /ORGANISM="Stauroneis constricta, Strain CCMP1120" /LENGTH=303 /DNA_ID=CAMNT_0007590371 /DNA_START=39 /DNA_END=950 /DNA_ORIENTATION=-
MKFLSILLSSLLIAASCVAAADSADGNEDNDTYQPLKVVFAGFGRTGSHSIAAGLDRLGYKSIHGSEIVPNILGSHSKMADYMIAGDVHGLLNETARMGYNATMDCHAVYWGNMWEMHKGNNDVKFIFTKRSFEPWFNSIASVRWTLMPITRYPWRFVAWADKVYRFSVSISGYNWFNGNVNATIGKELVVNTSGELSRKIHQYAYQQYFVKVDKILKEYPKQAIMFEIREGHGYRELCELVEIPLEDCPVDEPFPHVGSSTQMIRVGFFLRFVEIMMYLIPMIVVGLIYRRVGGAKKKQKSE